MFRSARRQQRSRLLHAPNVAPTSAVSFASSIGHNSIVPKPCSRKIDAEGAVSSRSLILPLIFVGLLVIGAIVWKSLPSPHPSPPAPALTIEKLPVVLTSRTFDPAAPPADMPPLGAHETAECDSNFLSSASVRGISRNSDSTHATLTITNVRVTLQLKINLWLPKDAPQNLIDHEDGHRQISQNTYDTADQLAQQIASAYIGKQIEITGPDLEDASNKTLQQLANEITSAYGKQLNPDPPQLLYDSITDHARNGVVARDAVDHVLKNAPIEASDPNPAPKS
jgi:hypothetical protein